MYLLGLLSRSLAKFQYHIVTRGGGPSIWVLVVVISDDNPAVNQCGVTKHKPNTDVFHSLQQIELWGMVLQIAKMGINVSGYPIFFFKPHMKGVGRGYVENVEFHTSSEFWGFGTQHSIAMGFIEGGRIWGDK